MRVIFIPKWARKISARKEIDQIVVTGSGYYPFGDDTLIAGQPASGESRWMHVEFSNSETEPELLAFVKKYGPVDGTFDGGVLYPVRISPSGFQLLTVKQSLGRLRELQQSVAAATRITALLQAGVTSAYESVNALCQQMASSLELEGLAQGFKDRLEFIRSGVESERTIKASAKTELSAARDLLCHFLDKFPPKLLMVKNKFVELPGYGENGILPIICYLLRQDLLSDFRTIGICDRCSRLFVVTRRGAQFCSPECSQLKRSLDYYHSHKGTKNISSRRTR